MIFFGSVLRLSGDGTGAWAQLLLLATIHLFFISSEATSTIVSSPARKESRDRLGRKGAFKTLHL